jgi:hypothetical protein
MGGPWGAAKTGLNFHHSRRATPSGPLAVTRVVHQKRKFAQVAVFGADSNLQPKYPAMIIERVNLQHIKQQDHVSTLQALEVGESIYCDDARKAQSIRVLSYYLVRSRKLDRKFVFRKMDRGWRIIRVI